MMKIFLQFFIGFVFLFTSCKQFVSEGKYDGMVELPRSFSVATQGEVTTKPWWQDWQNDELNRLVSTALNDNLSLQQSWTRLQQAEQLVAKSAALQKPSLGYSAGTTLGKRYNTMFDRVDTVEEYNLGLQGGYELDLWGKLRANRRAVTLQYRATYDDLKTVAITISARVSETWVRIISDIKQQKLLEEQLRLNKDLLKLLEYKLAHTSRTNALDVLQQRQTVAAIESKIPLLRSHEKVLRNELAVLLGKGVGSDLQISCCDFPKVGKLPALGLPVQLLISRPDISAARKRLQADDWRVAVAKADFMPAIRLSAVARLSSGDLSTLFDNWLATLAGNVTGSIFDGGRRTAEVKRAKAVVEQRLLAYRQVVLNATKEVENSLIREAEQQKYLQSLRNEIAIASKTLEQAKMRYQKGLNDYLPVMYALLKLQGMEQVLIQQEANLLIYRISLYRSLGGVWLDSVLTKIEK